VGVAVTLSDVSETTRGIAASRTALAAYRLASEAASDGVMRIDRHGIIVWVSASVLRFAGGDPDPLLGQPVTSWVHPDDAARLSDALFADESHDPFASLECRWRTGDGEYRWVAARIRPIRDRRGTIAGAVLGLRDVHDQASARKVLEGTARELQVTAVALAESERLYRMLADNGTDSVFLVDLTGTFTWVSPATRQVLGYDPQSLTGSDAASLIHPDDLAVLLSIRRRVDSGEIVREEMRHLTADGEYRWMASVTNPALDSDGAVVGRIVALRDVHDQVLARQALVDSEHRFKSMFETHNAVMLLVEPATGAIVDANRAAAGFYGYSADELRSMFISELNVLPPEEVARRRAEAVEHNRNHFVFPHRLANGEIRTVDVYSSQIEDHGRRLLFSIIHDVTDRVEYESQLQQAAAISGATAAGVIVMDAGGVVTQVNPAFASVTGWVPEAVVGKNARSLMFSMLKDEDAEQVGIAIRAGSDFRAELSILREDGAEAKISISVSAVSGPQGTVTGYVVVLTDVSDRAQALQQVADSELRYGLLADNADDVIARIDLSGVFTWLSPATERVLGYHSSELVGTRAADLAHPDDGDVLRSVLARFDRGERESHFETRVRTASGEYRWMSGIFGPALDIDGTVIGSVATFRDVNEQVLT
ncbi:MAG: PAS domain-containing protein, partial [Actinomycetes bacterium]